MIAGESSGDMHGAKIIWHLQKANPSITFSGLGGEKMQALGFSSLVSIDMLAVMGFWEVLKKIFFFIRLENKILTHIQKIKPEKIILIDYPGLNLRLAQRIKKKMKTKIIYYISPQLWAWKGRRVEIVKQYIDTMIVLFPFEINWYQKHNVVVQYFGHPLVGGSFEKTTVSLRKKPPYNIALCPGSRPQEIKAHMPVLISVIAQVQKIQADVRFEIFCAPNIPESFLRHYIKGEKVYINHKPILKSFSTIDFAVVASGTASLECAITLTPMVVIYKMSWLSWKITKLFVASSFASIVNVLANKKIVGELLQKDCNSTNILHAINGFISNVENATLRQEFIDTIEPLALDRVYERTSRYILNYQ